MRKIYQEWTRSTNEHDIFFYGPRRRKKHWPHCSMQLSPSTTAINSHTHTKNLYWRSDIWKIANFFPCASGVILGRIASRTGQLENESACETVYSVVLLPLDFGVPSKMHMCNCSLAAHNGLPFAWFLCLNKVSSDFFLLPNPFLIYCLLPLPPSTFSSFLYWPAVSHRSRCWFMLIITRNIRRNYCRQRQICEKPTTCCGKVCGVAFQSCAFLFAIHVDQ